MQPNFQSFIQMIIIIIIIIIYSQFLNSQVVV